VIEFVAWGTPIPKGSMVCVTPPAIVRKTGRPVLAPVNASKMRSWSRLVKRAAEMTGKGPLEGAIRVTVTFWLRRPKKPKAELPVVRPDLDKLLRAVCDAIKGPMYSDDSQVTTATAMKRYTRDRSCAVIRIEEDS